MLAWLEQFLVRYPELALFLVLAAGYWIGSFKIGAVSLGPVTGALFAGLLVGQFAHVPVSGMTKSFLFLLFLFGIGYSVGPQFILALKRDGPKPVLLAVVVCITGLAASILVAKMLRLDPGFAARLVSDALTQHRPVRFRPVLIQVKGGPTSPIQNSTGQDHAIRSCRVRELSTPGNRLRVRASLATGRHEVTNACSNDDLFACSDGQSVRTEPGRAWRGVWRYRHEPALHAEDRA